MMFSSVTPATIIAFLAPATRASMIGVFHLAWTIAIRSAEPAERERERNVAPVRLSFSFSFSAQCGRRKVRGNLQMVWVVGGVVGICVDVLTIVSLRFPWALGGRHCGFY